MLEDGEFGGGQDGFGFGGHVWILRWGVSDCGGVGRRGPRFCDFRQSSEFGQFQNPHFPSGQERGLPCWAMLDKMKTQPKYLFCGCLQNFDRSIRSLADRDYWQIRRQDEIGMINHSTDNWSLCIGRPGGVELRVHVLWPLTTLAMLLAVKSNLVDPHVAMWALLVFMASVALHELARAVTASRVGGHPSSLVLGPIGGLTKLHLPVDPPAHLVTALAGPMTYLVLLVGAGCGLALAGDQELFRLLLNPCEPNISPPFFVSTMTTLVMVAQLTVWINWCLLLTSLLPVDPCDGAELLRGILWPMVGRTTATSATSRIALGSAVFMALLVAALLIPDSSSADSFSSARLPTWFPLGVISIFLLYGGYRQTNTRHYDVGLMLDEFDSDDEEWLLDEWEDEDREAVLVEHLQDKQQEAIDRKRRQREANEDKRVDAILLRLRDTSFDQLSEEDRATLKRASRRYRERRAEHESND